MTALIVQHATARRSTPRKVLSLLTALLVILLPIDWFEFTGNLLREAGAKPAILVSVALAAMALLMRPRRRRCSMFENQVGWTFFALLYLGTVAFLLNLLLGWSAFSYARSPLLQFASQAGLLLLFGFTVHGLMRLFSQPAMRDIAVRVLPWAAVLHFAVFALESLGLIESSSGWLSWFRTDGGAIERPTGLTSEPSYFGTLAALYGTPLILQVREWRPLRALLGLALIVGAVMITAKTVFVVLLCQLLLLAVYGRGNSRTHYWLALLIALVLLLAVWTATTTEAIDLETNLSSVMRIGSNLLAANVSLTGYGVAGVGLGQFHFFYQERFAPDFLFASAEALSQFDLSVDQRASTFNLFLRLLIETGAAGLLVFLALLHHSLRIAGKSLEAGARLGFLLVAGSIGFLSTQDTYFYPPLALGLALALTAPPPRAKQKRQMP